MNWLTDNWLACYGAITGTLALFISYLGHRHAVNKDTIKLSVSFSAHPNQEENIKNMLSTEGKEPWEQTNFTEVYLVTVKNLGSIPAPLEDVGVITSSGDKKQALTSSLHSHGNILSKISDSKLEPLIPQSAKTFKIYLERAEPVFKAKKAYAVDQTGKLWCSRT
ncbi:hypothetical protein ACRS3X_13695 [Ectopseudomonas hydrolytica]|uniref:hypothetical protein n=1 Tax=Ectopseudomonas hydrolytica TaxID=2493633 RepID=UPI003EE287B1